MADDASELQEAGNIDMSMLGPMLLQHTTDGSCNLSTPKALSALQASDRCVFIL